ncbi:TonB-dependent receptor [Sphingomonas sp. SUN019]|uniref:TonB-dependent receptor plug domain-containing protein n=1 Tax=Sphingomonas sp. SUN019 TaxID=2937788 RepID=UPI002164AC1E|nr:TonB-dependent receptor [Sphingomonas sp. SUN019]UVO50127.1 TonB-dependent receptor [Sphingomonas sp. SUN019]
MPRASAIMLGSSVASVALATVCLAQTIPDQALDQIGAVAAAPDYETSDIIVTGTRITRPDYELPNPIQSFGAAQIDQSGKTNITDFLTQTPALIGSSDSNANAGSNAGIGTTGINLLNLRNLGTNRTLVLVNGRRHVAAVPGGADVDVNTIPVDLIDRVDIVTGGASAIYGADAVTGVVNFVLKRNFDGITARAQAGISERGDAGKRFASITVGRNFVGDTGNIALNYEYSKEDRLDSQRRTRNLSRNRTTFQNNPDDPDDDPNVPDNIPLTDVRFFDSARGGGIDSDFDGVPDFNFDGSPWDPGRFAPPFFQQGGSGTPRADYIGDLLPSIERHSVNALGHVSITPAVNFFVEGKYVHTKSFSISQPTFDFSVLIQPDNPYLPASLRDIAIANEGVLVNRDNFDLGTRGEDITRRTIRSVVGFDGKVTDHARFEVSYVHGETKVNNNQLGNRFNDRFYSAVDAVVNPATGAVTCRSNLDPTALPGQPFANPGITNFGSFTPGPNSGCVSLNLFGEGSPSPAAVAFVTTTSTARSRLTQHVLSGSISGDFGELFALPGGPVSFAIGAEYRREASRSTPAPEDTAGFTFNNVLSPSRGHFDVKEIFAELNAPLLKHVPFADELAFGAAIRFSDYSTIGRTTTWKVDARWSPIPDISFRGTYAEAVRAPNIGELFNPANQTFQFINDPCDIANINNGAPSRTANCAALLTAAGADPVTFVDPNSASVAGNQAGNTDLIEETAKTKTVGIVLRPRFLPGLSASIDGYDIKLANAITTVTAQRLSELCVDQATLDNQFCPGLTRAVGGATPGRITNFTLIPQNVADFRTRGIDLNLNYRFTIGDIGTFNLRAVGGYLDRLTFIGSPGATPTNERNQSLTTNGGAAPKWLVNLDATWTNGPLTVNYGLNYFGRTLRFERTTSGGDPDYVDPQYFYIKPRWEHDVQVSVDAGDRFTFYVGANNVFDQQPDFASLFYPVSGVGRFIYAGAKVQISSN